MLYLIKSPSYGDKPLLKIGYTNDLETRLKAYKTHNPQVELIFTREGDQELEQFLHKYFIKYAYPDQPEWFYFNDYIVDNFLKINLEDFILKETLIDILNQQLKFDEQNIKNLENRYIEKYGEDDFQLRKCYLYRIWRSLDRSLSEYTLEGNCPDKIPIESIITIKNLPFGLGSISLDFLKIMGRQRLNSNQKNNTFILYFKPLEEDNKKPSQEEFNEIIQEKIKTTNDLLSAFDMAEDYAKLPLAKNYLSAVKYDNYKTNYLSVNEQDNQLKPVFNNLILISEQRAFDIQSANYKDRFSVFNRKTIYSANPQTNEEISKFFEKYNKIKHIQDRLRFICESGLSENARTMIESSVDDLAKKYLALDKNRLKACGYKVEKLRIELDIKNFDKSLLGAEIYKAFEPGKTYTKANIKSTLKLLYDKTGYKTAAKATDLSNWFEIESTMEKINGKKVNSFRLIKKKGN